MLPVWGSQESLGEPGDVLNLPLLGKDITTRLMQNKGHVPSSKSQEENSVVTNSLKML